MMRRRCLPLFFFSFFKPRIVEHLDLCIDGVVLHNQSNNKDLYIRLGVCAQVCMLKSAHCLCVIAFTDVANFQVVND